MENLDEYFNDAQDSNIHPKLKFWLSKLEDEKKQAKLELYRPRDILGFKAAKIYVHFYENGEEVDCDKEDWEDKLNNELIENGIQAITQDNEIERFALTLRANLRRAEERFGDGYFNAVLLEVVKTKFTQNQKISKIIKQIAEADSTPYKDSTTYKYCREMVEHAIKTCAQNLTKKLAYSRPEAEKILLEALAQYLDERFSVTDRHKLGLV